MCRELFDRDDLSTRRSQPSRLELDRSPVVPISSLGLDKAKMRCPMTSLPSIASNRLPRSLTTAPKLESVPV